MNDYQRIASVINYLDEHHTEQPDLATLAAHIGLSPYHFHRLFSRWAGITPKDFLQCLTLSHVKALLRQGESVLNTSLDAGLSGPGRLHDLCVILEAASPGEIKSGGADWTINAGVVESPFGLCLVGESPRGICHLSFVASKNRRMAKTAIRGNWPHAQIHWNDTAVEKTILPLFTEPTKFTQDVTLRAIVRGTPFQVHVWRALLNVPRGTLISYGRLAHAMGRPTSARTVGSAVGKNPLAYLIPCHRVIRETGVVGEYRWGTTRKKVMMAWEGAERLEGR